LYKVCLHRSARRPRYCPRKRFTRIEALCPCGPHHGRARQRRERHGDWL